MGRWLEKLTNGRFKRLVVESPDAYATQSVIDNNSTFPAIEMKFALKYPSEDPRTKNLVDEIVIYMPLKEAIKFTNQLNSSVDAAVPSLPRRSYRIPFE